MPTTTPNTAHRIGTPTGVNGINARHIVEPIAAAIAERRSRSSGQTIATNAAGKAASSPNCFGSIAEPRTAPINVPMFQNRYTLRPVIQKAARRCVSSDWLDAIAVDSSIVICAATSLVATRPFKCGAIAKPYTELRAASSAAPPNAAAGEPP